jgi:hypothetical protein
MHIILMLLLGFCSGIITAACGYSYFNPETMISAIIINGVIILVGGIIIYSICD